MANTETVAADIEAMPIYYYLDVKLKNVNADIKINGMSVVKNQEGENINSAEMINLWLMPMSNELKINLAPLQEKSTKVPTVEVILFLHDSEKEYPTPKKIIARYVLSEELEKDNTLKLPLAANKKIELSEIVPTKVWGDAVFLKGLSEQDKIDIISLVNGLEESILKSDLKSVLNYYKYKISEDAAAEGKSFSRMQEVTSEDFQWAFEQGKLHSDGYSLNKDNAEFNICCANRIVNVNRKEGLEALSVKNEKLALDLDVSVSKINNRWVIVR